MVCALFRHFVNLLLSRSLLRRLQARDDGVLRWDDLPFKARLRTLIYLPRFFNDRLFLKFLADHSSKLTFVKIDGLDVNLVLGYRALIFFESFENLTGMTTLGAIRLLNLMLRFLTWLWLTLFLANFLEKSVH